MLLSAFPRSAWGAEAAHFSFRKASRWPILAWLQTLPEFAVEAVIAWGSGPNPRARRISPSRI